MKQTKKYPHLTLREQKCPAYPNAADEHYFAAKALNVINVLVSGMGFATAMVFLGIMA